MGSAKKIILILIVFLIFGAKSTYSQGLNANLNELISPNNPLDLIGHYRINVDFDRVTGEDYGSFAATSPTSVIESFTQDYKQIWANPQNIREGVMGGYVKYLFTLRGFGALIFSCEPDITMSILHPGGGSLAKDKIISLSDEGEKGDKYVFDTELSYDKGMDIVSYAYSDNTKYAKFLVITPKSNKEAIDKVMGMGKWVKVEVVNKESELGIPLLERTYSLHGVDESVSKLPCHE